MLIKIDQLKGRPFRLDVDESAAGFPILHELIERSSVEFKTPVKGWLEATWVGDILEVTGQLGTQIVVPCGRCLAPVAQALNVSFTLCYAEAKDGADNADAEEIELQGEELGLITFTGLEIDLKPDLEQELIMALPQLVLCQEACQGLCPVCGENLNQGQCNCERPVFSAGLAALKNFKVDK